MTLRRLLQFAPVTLLAASVLGFTAFQIFNNAEPEFLTKFHAVSLGLNEWGDERIVLDGDFKTIRTMMREELAGKGWKVWESGPNVSVGDEFLNAARGREQFSLNERLGFGGLTQLERDNVLSGKLGRQAKPVVLIRHVSPNWAERQWSDFRRWLHR